MARSCSAPSWSTSRARRRPLARSQRTTPAGRADVRSTPPIDVAYWIGPGRSDVAFLGAAQVDRFANLNSTVIGSYENPSVRLPGAGGAPEIATGRGNVAAVITDLGVLEPDPESEELTLTQVHDGARVDAVRAATGWDLAVAAELAATPPPTDAELGALRELLAR